MYVAIKSSETMIIDSNLYQQNKPLLLIDRPEDRREDRQWHALVQALISKTSNSIRVDKSIDWLIGCWFIDDLTSR